MVINKGSIESIIVKVSDALGDLTNLPPTTFDITDTDGNPVLADQAAVVDGLQAQCTIDTTGTGFDIGGDYFLYLKFVSAPDSPILGPHQFRVR